MMHLWPQTVWPFQKKSPRSESAQSLLFQNQPKAKKAKCDAVKSCQVGHSGKYKTEQLPAIPTPVLLGMVGGKPEFHLNNSRASVPQWKWTRSQHLFLQKTAHIQIFKIPIWFFWWILSDDEFMFAKSNRNKETEQFLSVFHTHRCIQQTRIC